MAERNPRSHPTAPPIGVWGAYKFNNFGDDLMAVMIALHLRDKGFFPTVYQLNRVVSSEYDIETSFSIEEICKNSCALIIGGGGLLCGTRLMDEEWIALELALSRHPIPIHAVSIGSHGTELDYHCSSSCQRVLSSNLTKSASLRLRCDKEPYLKLIDDADQNVSVYPDIVLSLPFLAASLLPAKPDISKTSTKILLFNVGKNLFPFFVELLLFAVSFLTRVDLRFAQTHLDECISAGGRASLVPDYEYVSRFRRSSNLRYESLKEYLFNLSKSSVVFSSKLHIGCAGMALGAKFISVNAQGKTRAFLKELGQYSRLSTGGKMRIFLLAILSVIRESPILPVNLFSSPSSVPLSTIDDQRKAALGHFAALDCFLSLYAFTHLGSEQ
jgi:hypothetical protein